MNRETKFDGNYVTESTGATRSSREGKGRYDLIPANSLERVAKVYQRGADVHGDWNWAKGMKYSRLLDSAMRHINQFRGGCTSEDHLAQAIWNLMGVMYFEDCDPSMNDLRSYAFQANRVYQPSFDPNEDLIDYSPEPPPVVEEKEEQFRDQYR